jgi:MFS family permease
MAAYGGEAEAFRPLFPWFYGWNVLAVGMLSMAVAVGLAFSSFSFFAVAWIDEFGTSRGETVLIMSISQLVTGLVYPFAGRAMDRYSIRWVGIAGILSLALGLALSALATSLWHLIFSFGLLVASGNALAGSLLGHTLAAKWFRKHSGLAQGLVGMGISFGALVFPLLITFLLDITDWRQAMLVLAVGVSVLVVPLMLTVVRDSPEDRGVAPEPEAMQGAVAHPPVQSSMLSTAQILRDPFFWAMLGAYTPIIIIALVMTANLAPLGQDLGISPQATGFLMSVWSIANMMGKIACGTLADRVEQRLIYLGTMAVTVLSLVLLLSVPGYVAMILVMAAMGLGSGAYMPLIGVMARRHFGAVAFGSVMGLFLLSIRPMVLAPPLAAWVRDSFGTYNYFWAGCLVLCLCCTPVAWYLRSKPVAAAK